MVSHEQVFDTPPPAPLHARLYDALSRSRGFRGNAMYHREDDLLYTLNCSPGELRRALELLERQGQRIQTDFTTDGQVRYILRTWSNSAKGVLRLPLPP
jgi:hypothetical protein